MTKSYFELKPVSFRGKVAVVAPSGTFNKQLFNAGINHLKFNKIKPSWNRDIFDRHFYLAGTEKRRADELIAAFLDEETEAIWAARGGFGAIHLLPYLDERLDEIKKNGKLLIGFSDITILQSYFVEKCGFVAVHGPNITTINNIDNYSKNQVVSLLQGNDKAFSIFNKHIYPVRHGVAKAIVKGGNLASLVSLMGTEYEPDFDGSILFLEDVGEFPYKVDRMLTQMRYAGKFKNLKGVILGDFSYREKNPPATKEVNFNMIIEKMGIPNNIPVAAKFPSGHGKHNMAFLLGAVAELNSEKRSLSYITE